MSHFLCQGISTESLQMDWKLFVQVPEAECGLQGSSEYLQHILHLSNNERTVFPPRHEQSEAPFRHDL